LGYEVEGVRNVVEGLLRDKEEKLEERRWQVEEDDRRTTLNNLNPMNGTGLGLGVGREAGTDERPGTPSEDAGSSRMSFVSVSFRLSFLPQAYELLLTDALHLNDDHTFSTG
jgi:hypothetical protein